ncbi:MAG: hypothetical protein HY870_20830 [Chloroflexi bacterium]|nr:hypothetical protein [Chloroflexota bacterium]
MDSSTRIEVPDALLKRAQVQTPGDARDLVTFLLEQYVLESDKGRREQAYEAYFAQLTPEEAAEEIAVLNDFATVDAEADEWLDR